MINGSDVIIENGSGEIVGQMEMTLTFNGEPIDINNKSFDSLVTLMNGELRSKQLQISGSIVYNNNDQYKKVRADSLNGIADIYTISYISNLSIVEMFTASMIPNGLSDALTGREKVVTAITFLSSGPVTTLQEMALITDLYPVINLEDGPMAGSIGIDYINVIPLNFETPLMSGIIGIEELTLDTVVIEASSEEEPMAGSIDILELTLLEILIEDSSEEEPMSGVIDIEELTLDDVLVAYSEEEEAMSGTIEIQELTLVTA